MHEPREQHIPLKVYRSEKRITVAAPMPGLEPSDITVEVTDAGLLTLRGELRDNTLDAARASLGDDAFATLWSEAGELPLEQIVRYIPAR